MKQRLVKPAKCECQLLDRPISPCEILPRGFPGTMTINATLYAVAILGSLPAEGEPTVDGYRLTKENGEAHDLCLVAGRLECTCGDYEFRRAPSRSRLVKQGAATDWERLTPYYANRYIAYPDRHNELKKWRAHITLAWSSAGMPAPARQARMERALSIC